MRTAVEIQSDTTKGDLSMVILIIFLLVLIVAILDFVAATQNRKKDESKIKAMIGDIDDDNDRLSLVVEKIKKNPKSAKSMPESILEDMLKKSGLGKNDIDLLFRNISALPGDNIHAVIDGTRSMRSNTPFVEAVVRALAEKAGKTIRQVTIYKNGGGKTYKNLSKAMKNEDFKGKRESMRAGLLEAARNSMSPSSYLVVTDQPSADGYPTNMPAPVFPVPLVYDKYGLSPSGEQMMEDLEGLAKRTGGKVIKMRMF